MDDKFNIQDDNSRQSEIQIMVTDYRHNKNFST